MQTLTVEEVDELNRLTTKVISTFNKTRNKVERFKASEQLHIFLQELINKDYYGTEE